jgi:peptide-methionine (S)-S-oxide reductase
MMKSISVLLFSLALTANACGQKADKQQNEESDVVSISEYIEGKSYENYEVATFAGGCFWCTEAAFERIEGVVDVISGYSGGKTEYPTYYQVGGGSTGHAEAIQIYYDAEVVDFETLLEVLFVAHDPTQLNRQGPDVGTEYRSAVFYHGEEQKATTESVISKLDASGKFDNPIVTEVSPYDEFWVAEGYHQDYYGQHPENPYVQRISKPKVKKVEKEFADLLKKEYKK